MRKLVTGVFRNRKDVEVAADVLIRHGFTPGDIGVLMSDSVHGKEFTVHEATKAPEGVAAGAALGGALGAIVAGLAAVGSIVVPGLGFVAAGPLLAALAGAGAGAATGGAIGGVVGATIPEHEVRMLEQRLVEGSILMGVSAPADQVDTVRNVLRLAGGLNITIS